jgi:hypothetical protein
MKTTTYVNKTHQFLFGIRTTILGVMEPHLSHSFVKLTLTSLKTDDFVTFKSPLYSKLIIILAIICKGDFFYKTDNFCTDLFSAS